ncbi:oligosaccharide flippase family protein [Ekhidna sp.]|uniref:oligosaccharide flippase family protein n=1 Tax=Ekhidna sp. TaxID=2608089 RepID=UPI003298E126
MKAAALLKSSALYGILNFLPLASRFVLFPIFVNFLSPYDYGVLGLHSTMMQFFLILMLCGLNNTLSRFYFNYKHNRKQLEVFFSTILITVLVVGIVISLTAIFVGPVTYPFLFEDSKYLFFPYGLLSVIFAFTLAINAVILVFLRNEKNLRAYAILAGGAFILSTISESIAILILNADAQGVLIARLLGISVVTFGFLFYYLSKFSFSFNINFIKETSLYSISLLPYTLLGFAYLYLDRIMIENILSVESLAIYSVAFTIASVLEVIINAIDQAVVPEVFSLLKEGQMKNQHRINKIFRVTGVSVLFLACLILAGSPLFILKFVPPTYDLALSLIPVLLVGFLIQFYYGLFSKFLFYSQKASKFLPAINLIATITVFLNIYLIPMLGLLGVGLVMVITRLSLLPLSMWFERRFIKFQFHVSIINAGFLLFSILIALNVLIGLKESIEMGLYYLPIIIFMIFSMLFVAKHYKEIKKSGMLGLLDKI